MQVSRQGQTLVLLRGVPTVMRMDTFPGARRLDPLQRLTHIEALARIACQLAGRDPDQHLRMQLGEDVTFDDLLWRYDDFIRRAEAAYALLDSETLPQELEA